MRLDRETARRIAVRAAGLDEHRPPDAVAMVRELVSLRVELTSILCPSADHIAYTRLGPSHRPVHLERALTDGRLFERGWLLHPMEDLPLFLAGMRTWLDRDGGRRWVDANAAFRQGILDRIADEGPLTSREIPDEAIVPWESSGWTQDRNVTTMLDIMHMTGDLAVVGRVGRFRVWDLAERVYPADAVEVPWDEARRRRAEQVLRASGVIRDSVTSAPGELHTMPTVGEPVEIEGVPGRWRVDAEALASAHEPFAGRTAILSPFDRLVFDRTRAEALWGFEYGVDMYKPASRRRWGPFALAVLHEERLVGKVDARADRASGEFVVNAVHEDEPFTASMTEAVHDELDGFAAWLGLRIA
ncbi:DNA glycosylase AlkZ-like family protein [Pseudolysinimonas kribbensis]|uniref:DNA glycosylase AlkZ-like family protein n=1 Tax=Pseudolysinimonas kribbensis TaxID=433641 RepID=UPI0031DF63D1